MADVFCKEKVDSFRSPRTACCNVWALCAVGASQLTLVGLGNVKPNPAKSKTV